MKKIVKNAIITATAAIVINDTIALVRYTKKLKEQFPLITNKEIIETAPAFWKYCFEIGRDYGYIAKTPSEMDSMYRAFLTENYDPAY